MVTHNQGCSHPHLICCYFRCVHAPRDCAGLRKLTTTRGCLAGAFLDCALLVVPCTFLGLVVTFCGRRRILLYVDVQILWQAAPVFELGGGHWRALTSWQVQPVVNFGHRLVFRIRENYRAKASFGILSLFLGVFLLQNALRDCESSMCSLQGSRSALSFRFRGRRSFCFTSKYRFRGRYSAL